MRENAQMPWPALHFAGPGRAGGFYQMLLNAPERQLITPVVRKITLCLWVCVPDL